MEKNGYSAVNSKKTIFMKCRGNEYIILGIFVDDDMLHIYSCDAMKNEFLALFKRDFDNIGGNKMQTLQGMVFEQSNKTIKNHF